MCQASIYLTANVEITALKINLTKMEILLFSQSLDQKDTLAPK